MKTRAFLAARHTFIFLLIFLLSNPEQFAQNEVPTGFCISPKEEALFNQLNQVIEAYGKTELELSSSLSYVASVHVNDLLNNRPDTSICNLSSWSDKGEWTACCHNRYVPQQDCMWDKPKELTKYPYRGYELVGYFEEEYTVDSVLKLWTNTKEVLDMLLTEGNFKKKKWICMGIGMNSHYVSVWFGQRSDNEKPPTICTDTAYKETSAKTGHESTRFYVIFGSYNYTRDAKEAVKQLAREGFENADILKHNEMVRVYLKSFSTVNEATSFKQGLPHSYREAWIYKE